MVMTFTGTPASFVCLTSCSLVCVCVCVGCASRFGIEDMDSTIEVIDDMFTGECLLSAQYSITWFECVSA